MQFSPVTPILLRKGASAVVSFTTAGATVAPVLQVVGSPSILWQWSDGTTDTSATPTKNFYELGVRTHTLHVEPWSAVTGLSLVSQSLNEIHNLNLLQGSISLDLSDNGLSGADFAACTQLQQCRIVDCLGVQSLKVPKPSSFTSLDLHRLSLSSAQVDAILVALDQSAVVGGRVNLQGPAMGTITATGEAARASLLAKGWTVYVRSALSNTITFESSGATWQGHCTVSDGAVCTWTFTEGPTVVGPDGDWHNFGTPGIRAHTLTVDPPEALLSFEIIAGIPMNSVTGLSNFPNLEFLRLYQCSLSHLDLSGCPSLKTLYLVDNTFSQETVDDLYIQIDRDGPSHVSSGAIWNASPTSPSAASAAARASLASKGYDLPGTY